MNLVSNENYFSLLLAGLEKKSGVTLVILHSTLYFGTSILSNDQNIFVYKSILF